MRRKRLILAPLTAVQEQPVRTPRVLAVCADEDVIGAPFYVMERIEGDVITTRLPAPLEHEGARIGAELIDALVEVHAVDWRACGLEGYGKPTGYLERQLRRFSGLWEHNRTRELPVLDRVTAWLGERVPASPAVSTISPIFTTDLLGFPISTNSPDFIDIS